MNVILLDKVENLGDIGDLVTVELSGLAELSNPVVGEESSQAGS